MWNKISSFGMPVRGDYSVLAYHVNGSVEMVHCDDLRLAAGLRSYTHWMPLPAPPTAENAESANLQQTTEQSTPCKVEHNHQYLKSNGLNYCGYCGVKL